MRPLLSIIVPVHNGATYLDECLKSIAEQTLENIEVIVVDDGSSDGSWEIMKRWAIEDSRFRLMRNMKPSGNPGTPRNQALPVAKGRYIGFVDSDDWIDREYFRNFQISHSENVDIFQSIGFTNHNGANKCVMTYPLLQETHKNFKKYIFGDAVWDKVYRRDMLWNNHIFLGVRRASVDVPFVAKAAFYQTSSQTVPQVGYHYRRGAKGSTISLRESTDCDFVIGAYMDILAWAEKIDVDEQYKNLLHLKMAINLIYTLGVVSPEHHTSFYAKCRQLLHAAKLEEIADMEECIALNFVENNIRDILRMSPNEYAQLYRRKINYGMNMK